MNINTYIQINKKVLFNALKSYIRHFIKDQEILLFLQG